MGELIRMFEAYDKIEFTADMCLKCNICTSTCPVAPVTELFRPQDGWPAGTTFPPSRFGGV